MNPCHHTILMVVHDVVMDFRCVLDDGHDSDHEDDERRQWPAQTCDSDLHETVRPVLSIVGDDVIDREMCAECAGRWFLLAQTKIHELRALPDNPYACPDCDCAVEEVPDCRCTSCGCAAIHAASPVDNSTA